MSKRKSPSKGSGRNGKDGSDGTTGRDYKVGRGRPPQEFQFPPKKSGNPKGRPKGSKNRKTIVRAAERRTFVVKKAGRPGKMNTTELGLHNLQRDIAAGDSKAFVIYLAILERYSDSDETSASMQELMTEDIAILRNLMARKKRKKSNSEGDQ